MSSNKGPLWAALIGVVLVVIIAFAMGANDDTPTQTMDDAAEDAADAMGDAMDDAVDAMEDAADNIQDGAEEMMDDMNDAMSNPQ
jgi:hypothetical protein